MPNAYQQSILSLRYAPLKRTAETEERVLTALQTAADQLKRLIGNTDSPLTKKFYNRRRLQVAALMNQLAIGLKKDISDQVQAIADEVAAIMQEETNDLLQENLRADVVADFTQVPREVLNWSADRQDREGLKLSASIWADNQTNQIESVLLAGIARGESARNLSLKLEQFVLGGGQGMGDSVRSKAMRLARTEINNSYWEARRMSSELSPVVEGIKWELSARHPEWDVCDYLSKQDLYGLGPGVYPPELLPPKPHPNCLCYSVDTLRDVEAWGEPRDVPGLKVNPLMVPDGKKPNGFTENYIQRQKLMFVQSVTDTETAYYGRAPTPTPTPEPAPATFGDSVRREISQGLTSEQDYIRVGAMVRAEMAAEYETEKNKGLEAFKSGGIATTQEVAILRNLGKRLVQKVQPELKANPFDSAVRTDAYKSINRLVRDFEGTLISSRELTPLAEAAFKKVDHILDVVSDRYYKDVPTNTGISVGELAGILDVLDTFVKTNENTAVSGLFLQTSNARVVRKDLAQVVKKTLAQIRSVGAQGQKHQYSPGSLAKMKDMIGEAAELLPSDWVDNSISNQFELWAMNTQRGFYQHGKRRVVKGVPTYVGNFRATANSPTAPTTVLHEFGHRIEYTTPGVQDLEKEFYQRRTKGESLKWLGSGYKKNEQTRRDDFTDEYMGKDYGRDAWEILSMGLEGVFYGNYELYEKDQDYFDFILGLLAAK